MSAKPQIEQIFHEVLGCPIEDRPEALEALCGPDAALRAEVESLLRADAAPGSLVSPRVNASQDNGTVAAGPHPSPLPGGEGTIGEKAGEVIGHYKLLQQIGEGGFGTVFMAEQAGPLRRNVALKIIKIGMDTKLVIARFEAERQALAMMDHPNIARVFDAGATAAGRPYFVMELVKGIPLTEFCDVNHLSTRERLGLFQQVCKALHHAHQRGIIHRDIKPSNVLVTLHDGEPVPKVIDFGIAKATNARLTERTLFTEFRQFIGTPEYVSPEQAELSGLDVDTRSDVYSLGVLLYELLTGTTPFDSATLRSKGYAEMQRIIRESEPLRPSTRVNTLGEKLVAIAKHRQIDPQRLGRLIRGELDWIVMRAIEKDRRRRYDSASAFADDVRRYLDGEAVLASPASRLYRLSKFARRHRVGVAAGAAVVAALVLGVVGTTVEMFRAMAAEHQQVRLREQAESAAEAARESEERAVSEAEGARAARQAEADARTHAETEAANAKAVREFLESMLASVDPMLQGMRDRQGQEGSKSSDTPTSGPAVARTPASAIETTVAEMLDRAIPEIERATKGQPTVEAAIRQVVGRTLYGLGIRNKSADQLAAAHKLFRESLGDRAPERLRALVYLSEAKLFTGGSRDADKDLTPAIPLMEEVLGPLDQTTLRAKLLLGWAIGFRAGREEEAAKLVQQVASDYERVHGPSDPYTLRAKIVTAMGQAARGELEAAEAQAREVIRRGTERYGPDALVVLFARQALGSIVSRTNRQDEAITLLRQTYDDHARILGSAHWQTLRAFGDLVDTLRRQGRLKEAVALTQEIFNDPALTRNIKSGPPPGILDLFFAVERLHAGLPQDVGAIARTISDFAADRDARSAQDPSVLNNNFAIIAFEALRLLTPDELQSATDQLKKNLDISRAEKGLPEGRRQSKIIALAEAYAAAGRHEESLALSKEVHKFTASVMGLKKSGTYLAFDRVVRSMAALGNREEDMAYVEGVLREVDRELRDDPSERARYYGIAVWHLHFGRNQREQFIEWGRLAYETMLQAEGPDSWDTLGRLSTYANVLHLAGRTAEAEPLVCEVVDRCTRALRSFPASDDAVFGKMLTQVKATHAEMLATLDPSPERLATLEARCRALLDIQHQSMWYVRQHRRPPTMQLMRRLIELLEGAGQQAKAAEWKGYLDELQFPYKSRIAQRG